jgi:hypothetical protein
MAYAYSKIGSRPLPQRAKRQQAAALSKVAYRCWNSRTSWSGRTATYSDPRPLAMFSAISRCVSQLARKTWRKAGRSDGVQRLISLIIKNSASRRAEGVQL